MKYEKANVEIVKFDECLEFMAGSPNCDYISDYWLANGGHCGTYKQGTQCSNYVDGDGDSCPYYTSSVCTDYNHKNPDFYCGYFTESGCNGYEVEGGHPECNNFRCTGF